ncbi:MAG: hypothetical protein WB799_24215 [Candidatus Sulfotelmatobacter sp.]
MSTLSESFHRFKEGLRWKLLRDYWLTIKEHAWETLWGTGLVGIAFVFYTLYRAPSLRLLGWVVAWIILVAGYNAWRPYHLRLTPKLAIVSIHTVETPTNTPPIRRKFVQVLVKCATEAPLDNCRAQLLRVHKWVNGEWQPTVFDESVDLLWSNIDSPSVTLESGNDRRFNIFFVDNGTRIISVFAERISIRMSLTSAPSDIFKFDLRVSAHNAPPEYVAVKAKFGQNWSDLSVEMTEIHS